MDGPTVGEILRRDARARLGYVCTCPHAEFTSDRHNTSTCPYYGMSRKPEDMTNDHDPELARLEHQVRDMERDLVRLREQLAAVRDRRPQDTYDDGTYLVLENRNSFLAYVKFEGHWYPHNARIGDVYCRMPWRHLSIRMQETTAYRVVEMHQEV